MSGVVSERTGGAPATPTPLPAAGAAPVLPGAVKRSGSGVTKALEYVGPLAVFGLFIAFWYFMSYVGMSEGRRFLVPPPHQVLNRSFFGFGEAAETTPTIRADLLEGVLLSARVALYGLVLAIVLGMFLAVLMSRARWIERSIYPYAVALQAIPILAFVPLIGSFFDFNTKSRVIVCVIIALFPIIANTLFGLLSADQGQHDLFTLHGASRWTRLWKLQFPAALPSIFTGFSISAGLSVIGAVVGDFFFRQGEPGIGRLIDVYRSRNQNPEMYGAVILTAAMGILVFWLFGFLNRKAVGRWHEATGRS